MIEPLPDRPSSIDMVADRVRAVGRAWQAGDDDEARALLRDLAAEARLLASTYPLSLDPVTQRQRIAAERAPTGRGAS